VKTTFVVSDPHFFHNGMCIFTRDDGSKLRPWSCKEEMTEALIKNHNEVVRPQDRVYFLGDLIMNRRLELLEHFGRLNGDKVLIGGNHDLNNAREYLKYFRDVRGVHQFEQCVLTHIPIHPDSIERWKFNVHGHLHADEVRHPTVPGQPDPRYICVSMEQPWMNYRPIEWTELMKLAEERLHRIGGVPERKKKRVDSAKAM